VKYGSLPRSIAQSLPIGAIEPDHTPDGLDEATIDALIEQSYAEVAESPSRPSWMTKDASEQRRNRRHVRQAVRTLPDVLTTSTAVADDEAA
jgi:hypothetical protein